MLQAGYLEDWEWNATLSGAPQGGVASPVLSNIYLHRLDIFVETVLIPEYTRGSAGHATPPTSEVVRAIERARTTRRPCPGAGAAPSGCAALPSQDPHDPGYRRLRYVRYADDHLLGFAGPKAEAEQIKQRLAQFLRDDLKLELSPGQDADHPRPHRRGAVPRLRDHRPAQRPARSPGAAERSTADRAARAPDGDQGQERPLPASAANPRAGPDW